MAEVFSSVVLLIIMQSRNDCSGDLENIMECYMLTAISTTFESPVTQTDKLTSQNNLADSESLRGLNVFQRELDSMICWCLLVSETWNHL